jgi:internalin A
MNQQELIERARNNDPSLTELFVIIQQGTETIDFMIGNTHVYKLIVSSAAHYHDHNLSLEPLRNNTTLKNLEICRCGVQDVEPLRDNTTLREVRLYSNRVTSADVFATITTLEELHLDFNNVTDLSPFSHNTTLKKLYVKANNISSIEPLSTNTTITHLRLSQNHIVNLSPLKSMPIISLGIDVNPIDDISVLCDIPTLTEMSVQNNPRVKSFEPLVRCQSLRTVHMGGCNISDISCLKLCPSLRTLCADRNPIRDISFLSSVTNMESVSFRDCQIDAIPNFELSSVTDMTLSKNRISHIPIGTFYGSQVHTIRLCGNPIENVDFLLHSSIQACYLGRNRISDIGILSKHPDSLHILHLGHNPITDLSPLWGNTTLRSISFNTDNERLLKQYKTLCNMTSKNCLNLHTRSSLRCISKSILENL